MQPVGAIFDSHTPLGLVPISSLNVGTTTRVRSAYQSPYGNNKCSTTWWVDVLQKYNNRIYIRLSMRLIIANRKHDW